MALFWKVPKIVPLTLELALRFRDMQSLKGERHLQSKRAKEVVRLISDRKFTSPTWGEMSFHGVDIRGNGNHTSHDIVACMQAHRDGLDERSQKFVHEHLLTRGGPWSGTNPEDLPAIADKEYSVVLEKCTGNTEQDQVEFFSRYDSKWSVRSAQDLLGIYVGNYDDLAGLNIKRIIHAMAGVLRCARDGYYDKFGFVERSDVKLNGDTRGLALANEQVRCCIRWIIETVPEHHLYQLAPTAQVFAEEWVKHGSEKAEQVIERFVEMLRNEEDPASAWETSFLKKRNAPTSESLLKKGRTVMRLISEELFGEG